MINTRKIAAEYRLSHWAQIMKERSISGMSIKAYCESIGIHENIYYYWQKKLREAAIVEAQGKTGTIIMKQNDVLSPQVPEGWAVCEIEKAGDKEPNSIRIEIGKSRVEAHTGTDMELLAKVCTILTALC